MCASDAPQDMTSATHFVRRAIEEDIASGRFSGPVVTRFPPEPNGHLHIGHAKAIALDFGMALAFGGACNLRFDDTNPLKEEQSYVDGIVEDIRWLGYDWGDRLYYASDYFDQLHAWAVQLIRDGKAYVDSLTAEEIRAHRGTLTEPGRESPYRDRPVGENLDLFERMGRGEFPEGSHVLRAKIDMSSGNVNLRDPVMYRILHAEHHRTGDRWKIYPTYDWAHGQSDSIEGVTHSLCTLEFEDHRPLYDWFVEQLGIHHPRQIEFARLNLSHTITSKRKLARLVAEGHVDSWDDPRMPTLSGMRRRGYTPEAIRSFLDRVGVAKKENVIDIALLEHAQREDLNARTPRRMVVLDPLELVLDNLPGGQVLDVTLEENPEVPGAGSRTVPFSGRLFIERGDFALEPPPKFHRLAPGREVRLKGAYCVTCVGAELDPSTGEPLVVHCTFDPSTRGGATPDGRTVRGTLHWVSAPDALPAEVRLYDHLFSTPNPSEAADGGDFLVNLNPESRQILRGCRVEPSLANATEGDRFQFLRHGYFVVDRDSRPGSLVFNRTVGLRDTWAKVRRAAAE